MGLTVWKAPDVEQVLVLCSLLHLCELSALEARTYGHQKYSKSFQKVLEECAQLQLNGRVKQTSKDLFLQKLLQNLAL